MNNTDFGKECVGDIRRQATQEFRRNLRRRAVVLWLIIMGLATICGITGERWFLLENPQERLLYAVIYFLSVICMTLLSMLHWLSPRIMLLLKEMKLMRIDIAHDSTEGPTGAGESLVDVVEKGIFSRTLVIAVSLATIITLTIIATLLFPPSRPDFISKTYVEIDSGQAKIFSSNVGRNTGTMPLTSQKTSSSIPTWGAHANWKNAQAPASVTPPLADQTFYDEKGNPIPFTVDPQTIPEKGPYKDQYFFEVPLDKPVWPGEEWTLRSKIELHECPFFFCKEGDVWVFRIGSTWGSCLSEFQETVTLPAGAQLESVEPKPKKQWESVQKNGHCAVLEFHEWRRNGASFQTMIRYRLPK